MRGPAGASLFGWLFAIALVAVSATVAVACIGVLVRALWTGISTTNWQQADRKHQPVRYWFDIAAILAVCFFSIRWFLAMCSLLRPLLANPG